MTQELSTLMDGELDAQEAERAIRAVCGSDELKHKWNEYHLIGDALRGDSPRRADARRRIMAVIDAEPTVLAPRRLPAAAGRIAFAAAASVATVAVVGWMGLQQARGPEAQPALAKGAPAAQPGVVPVSAATPAHVNDYLVVHRQVPNADFYRPVANTAAGGR